MKRAAAVAVTAAVLVLALWWGRGGSPTAPLSAAPGDTPEACLERMFVAAHAGDVAAYLDCFTGVERQRLERELTSQSRAAFGRSLQAAVAALKGRAIFRSDSGDAAASQATYALDRIYENRTERQLLTLTRTGTTWRITTARSANAFQPANPYGAPVYEDTPAAP